MGGDWSFPAQRYSSGIVAHGYVTCSFPVGGPPLQAAKIWTNPGSIVHLSSMIAKGIKVHGASFMPIGGDNFAENVGNIVGNKSWRIEKGG